jgi:purine-nucleoside phosphorylase
MTIARNQRSSRSRALLDPYAMARESVSALRPAMSATPRVAVVLGTGLGGLANEIEGARSIPYGDLPHFPVSTVVGHAGRLVIGRLGGVAVAAMQGRFHLYEGYSPAQVVHPVRVLALLGAETLIVTNAAGGLNPDFQAGDLMLIRDHIGLPTLSGLNPLCGMNDETIGPRFPAMTEAYDAELRAEAREVAREQRSGLREGVYVMVAGPSYETPAELAFLRSIGGDAVGMSSVPEVIAARHAGMRVLAISCVTNVAAPGGAAPVTAPSHAEVVAVAEAAGQRLTSLVAGVIARVASR